jgi:hypothetical protein
MTSLFARTGFFYIFIYMSQTQIKEIIKQEYIKCAMDPVHFFRKYCYITHPTKGRVLFHLYPFQEEVLTEFRNNRFSIVNKSRQLGISTLVAGYSLWLMLFNKDKTVLCIATKQETARGMVEKVQFMYENLPSWLKGNQKPISNNKLSFQLANNSRIVATSAASDAGRSYAVSLLLVDEAAFIEGIDRIYTSIKPTIATGGGIIALSSPNGIGNWFHKMYTEAEIGKNDFKAIRLPWNLHPDRDEQWEITERANMSPREFAQEYDCDFLGSGNSVIEPDNLSFYEQTYIQEPVERRFMGGDFWIFQYPDYTRNYIISADVARGDGSDYSAFHVIDVDSCEQVAEYKSQVDTRTYGNMLVSVATEYNNALLVVENANVGWDVVNTVIEKGYRNMYYSPRAYGEMQMDKWMAKMGSDQTVPGFTTSVKTRPLVVSKMEAYIRDRAFIFRSKRLLEELRVFIWNNGKAQAQVGYNDDLVMALGIGLFTRDTGVKFAQQGMDLTRASIGGMSSTAGGVNSVPLLPNGQQNPYLIQTQHGVEDFTWVL